MGARIPGRRTTPWRCLLASAVLAACAGEARAGTSVIASGEPAGFADLTRESELMVDVYFAGVRRGEAMVRLTPETVTVLDARALVSILPPVTDEAAVLRAFENVALAANSERACFPDSDPAQCGQLVPADVGVIFLRDRFRLDVFLNPRFLALTDRIEEPYLPAPGAGVSLVNAVGALVSGQTGGGTAPRLSLTNQLVLARGTQRLRADASLDRSDPALDRLVLEWDRPERRYSAGKFLTPGSGLDGAVRMLGVGFESQIDTRRDREQLLGSPLVVFLDRRARVDTIYDGRVVSSRIYEAGNQAIETETLPEGAYEVVLRIEEAGGAAREERRFYSKSRRIPSLGREDFFLFGGYALSGAVRGSRRASGEFMVQGGYARRLAERFAVDAMLTANESSQAAELGASLITSSLHGRAAVIASTDGRLGATLGVGSTGTGSFNYSFDLRTVTAADRPLPAGPFLPHGDADALFTDQRAVSGYTQAGGLVSLGRGALRLLGTFYVRDEGDAPVHYGVGPSIEWDAARLGPAVLTMRSDISATDAGTSGFVGLSVRLAGRRGTATSLAGYRHSRIDGDARGSGPAGAWSAALNEEVLGGQASVGAGYEFGPGESNAIASLTFDHPAASLAADVVRGGRQGQPATTQYAVGLRTLMVAAPQVPVTIVGKSTTASGIVVAAAGARPADRFEVLIDEQVAGRLEGAAPLFLRLPDYRAYSVRIRPSGASLVSYDGAAREVGLYPGSVAKLVWDVAPVVIRYGRLVDAAGNPVGHASILGKSVWTQTDADGFFQLEAPESLALEVVTAGGLRYPLQLPGTGAGPDHVIRLGAVTCCDGGDAATGHSIAAASARKGD